MSAPVGPYTPIVRAGDLLVVSGQLGMLEGQMVAGGVAWADAPLDR
jgi:2-iminobutanoate/2-iminopropanoate deaminase